MNLVASRSTMLRQLAINCCFLLRSDQRLSYRGGTEGKDLMIFFSLWVLPLSRPKVYLYPPTVLPFGRRRENKTVSAQEFYKCIVNIRNIHFFPILSFVAAFVQSCQVICEPCPEVHLDSILTFLQSWLHDHHIELILLKPELSLNLKWIFVVWKQRKADSVLRNKTTEKLNVQISVPVTFTISPAKIIVPLKNVLKLYYNRIFRELWRIVNEWNLSIKRFLSNWRGCESHRNMFYNWFVKINLVIFLKIVIYLLLSWPLGCSLILQISQFQM